MELKDEHDNKLWQNLNGEAVYRKYGKALFILIFVTCLLSILLSVCVTSVPEPKVDPYPYTLQIISSTNSNTCFINDRGISNNDFGDIAVAQSLATWIQHGAFAFVFGEKYHSKVLVNDGNLTLTNYHTLDQSGSDKYDTVASDLVVPHLIIENSPSTTASKYLRDQYFMNQPKVVNGYGGDKKTSDNEYVVSIHPADYSDGCSNTTMTK